MPDLPTGAWNAHWISPSADPREDIGVFGFRRSFELDAVPSELRVRVSADQRNKLWVNGEFVGFGPQRGDPDHWFYETYDLAPFLQKGRNWIAALVWNFGRWAPMAQMSARTGFVLEGRGSKDEGRTAGFDPQVLSTPSEWEVARLSNWDFDMLHSEAMNFYIDIGPGEIIDFRGAPWGWRTGNDTPSPFSQSEKGEGAGGEGSLAPSDERRDAEGIWHKPNSISRAEDRGTMGGGTPWSMVPRSIPPMLYEEREEPPVVRRGFDEDSDKSDPSDGTDLPDEFRLEFGRKYLFDYGELLCAYPRLTLSGPPGTTATLTYAEGLWRKEGGKGNRDEVKGKKMSGYQDRIILDGERRTIEPLWWRTYRYLMIEAKSPSLEGGEGVGGRQTRAERSSTPAPPSKEGIVLHQLSAIETGYPLKEESSFAADDSRVKPIWDVSVRTARRCAGETYFDCPYYEQLQYVGDTRIQALIGYYLGRDRQLTRNAVETLGWSLMENGLTQSRYPSRQTQVIPPFSLWWVMMLWDQMLYDRHPTPAASMEAAAGVVSRFGELMRTPESAFWCFGDWVPNWGWGVPPGGSNSPMHWETFQLACAAGHYLLANHFLAPPSLPRIEVARVESLISHLRIEKSASSIQDPAEHAEALYRALQMMRHQDPDPWPTEALAKANAAKCTYYFSYYKHLAMFGRPEHEEGDKPDKSYKTHRSYPFDYLTELNPWKEMLEQGLSTFAENPEPTRSDCHAWSAHPILGFFQIVAGVTSTAPGWKKARIMPHPGSLKRFEANIAHPDGTLQVKFEDGRLEIDSPIPFELRWKGKREERKAGRHTIDD